MSSLVTEWFITKKNIFFSGGYKSSKHPIKEFAFLDNQAKKSDKIGY